MIHTMQKQKKSSNKMEEQKINHKYLLVKLYMIDRFRMK